MNYSNISKGYWSYRFDGRRSLFLLLFAIFFGFGLLSFSLEAALVEESLGSLLENLVGVLLLLSRLFHGLLGVCTVLADLLENLLGFCSNLLHCILSRSLKLLCLLAGLIAFFSKCDSA